MRAHMNKIKLLIIDDNVIIHESLKKIFRFKEEVHSSTSLSDQLFNTGHKHSNKLESNNYIIDSAFQGQVAFEMVKKANTLNEPYALAFVDLLMPPGWDGIETIQNIWRADPQLKIIICTAYSEHSHQDIISKLDSNNFLFLKKPFEIIEVRQMVNFMLHAE